MTVHLRYTGLEIRSYKGLLQQWVNITWGGEDIKTHESCPSIFEELSSGKRNKDIFQN